MTILPNTDELDHDLNVEEPPFPPDESFFDGTTIISGIVGLNPPLSPDDAHAKIEQIIASKDLDTLYRSAALLATLPKAEYAILSRKIKRAMPEINLSILYSIVAEEREVQEKANRAEREEVDADTVACVFDVRYGESWKYDGERQTWRKWIGTHWEEPYSDESGKYELDKIVVELLHEFGIDVKTNSILECVHRLIKGRCSHRFITRKGLINFLNGTLDVKTMELRPHCKEDYLFDCADYDYTPGGHYPNIGQFLVNGFVIIDEQTGARKTDYHAIQAYQIHVGLARLRDTSMHNACALKGPPRSGKGTAMRIANAVCGQSENNSMNYAGDSLFSSELEGKRARYTWNKARIVCADEISAEAFRDEGIVKDMMAHSGVEMRGMNKDEQKDNQWKPKLLLATNDKLRYKDTSGALKERILYLSLPITRPREDRNPRYFEENLEPELGAFVHTCIVLAKLALERWYYPQSANMKRISNEAGAEGNPLKAFIEEHCVVAKGEKISIMALYNRLVRYREDNGHSKNYSKQTMTSDLKDMSIGIFSPGKSERYEGKSSKMLYGIRLKTEDEEEQEGIQAELQDDELLLPLDQFFAQAGIQPTPVTPIAQKPANSSTSKPVESSPPKPDASALFELLEEVRKLSAGNDQTILWEVPCNSYTRREIPFREYTIRIQAMIKSRDASKMQAVEDELYRRLGRTKIPMVITDEGNELYTL